MCVCMHICDIYVRNGWYWLSWFISHNSLSNMSIHALRNEQYRKKKLVRLTVDLKQFYIFIYFHIDFIWRSVIKFLLLTKQNDNFVNFVLLDYISTDSLIKLKEEICAPLSLSLSLFLFIYLYLSTYISIYLSICITYYILSLISYLITFLWYLIFNFVYWSTWHIRVVKNIFEIFLKHSRKK